MADALVTVRKPGAPVESLELRINGPDANFRIGTEAIAAWGVAPVEDLSLDLLDIAGAVFAADRAVRRGGDTRPGFGVGWRRDLSFAMAVRRPEFWARTEVTEALVDAVSFLTDDQVSFAFSPGRTKAPQQDYLALAPDSGKAFQGDHVLLFSGGLDSLAGALETLETRTGKVVLVTHRSAQKITPHQNRLAEALQDRYPGRVRYVPIRATFQGRDGAETTQRSRSLLFAAFGYVIARMIGAGQVSFFENGVVSQNLPISRQVIGTMATRTTHPAALAKLEHLLSMIHDTRFAVENRFVWSTKTDIVTKLRTHGAADLIKDTVSCNNVRDRTVLETHCGACSQCLDRRFAILAAGLQDEEPEEMYETPVLTGERCRDQHRTMALDWTMHGLRLASMTQEQFAEAFLGELARIMPAFPDVAPLEVLRRSWQLQLRHGTSISRVVKAETSRQSDAIIDQSLPSSSLLRMIVATRSDTAHVPNIVRIPATIGRPDGPTGGDPTQPGALFPLRVSMFLRKALPVLEVAGLGSVSGQPAGAAHALRAQYETDVADGLEPDEHGYVAAGRLVPEAGSSKQSVTQNVKRCRDQLAEFHLVVEGAYPEHDLLIENRRPKGYRLDPRMILLPDSGQ